MERSASWRGPTKVITKWVARIWSILVFIFVAVMLIGEFVHPHTTEPISLEDIFLLVLFPCGVCLGVVLAWWLESLGGIISTACFITFYACMYLLRGQFPRGPYFLLIAAPGFLFLVSWLLGCGKQTEKSV